MPKYDRNNQHVTVVGFPFIIRILVLTVPPIFGLLLGYFLPSIAKWVITLPIVPFHGPLELIASFQEKWVDFATAVLGLIAGLWLTGAVFRESLVVTVSDEEVHWKINGSVQIISRADISAVFIENKKLVLLGDLSQELARETYESTPAEVADAFVQHRYPWSHEGDPYDAHYHRWVPDSPGLSPAINALLKAREKALLKKDVNDAKDLHREVSKLGIVVRDKGAIQYWREQKLNK